MKIVLLCIACFLLGSLLGLLLTALCVASRSDD